ncbi:MAG: branched-chain amino acid transport system II carrier protein [Chlamydiales bacterium]|nr:branched-chain amino acid transport system II carrier protein [Chlamydiales bacterium]
MQLTRKKPSIWIIGFAIFSMFFGAGNIIFPLSLGSYAQDGHLFAVSGLLITSIIVPFGGLFTMMLYEGNYTEFFARLGPKIGFLLAFFILLIMGPVGALPRCITTSYATTSLILPNLSIITFSLISCILIFLFTLKSQNTIKLIGLVLTPLLLLSLSTIIVKGLYQGETPGISPHSPSSLFLYGLITGYNTMDLIACFFFSSIVLLSLKRKQDPESHIHVKKALPLLVKAILLGGGLLAIIYVGFALVSASYSSLLREVSQDQFLATIAYHILGGSTSAIVAIAVFFTCLTTEIALAIVFTQFIRRYFFQNKVSYPICLLLTLLVAFLISTLRFEGISNFLVPILQICYPSLITLTALNLCYKLWDFKPVKIPVLIVFIATLISFIFM